MIEINPNFGDLVKLGEGKIPGKAKEDGLFDFHSLLVAKDTLTQSGMQSTGSKGATVTEHGYLPNAQNNVGQHIVSNEQVLSEQKKNETKADSSANNSLLDKTHPKTDSTTDISTVFNKQPKTDAFLKHIRFSTNTDNANFDLKSSGSSDVSFSQILGFEAQSFVQEHALSAHSDLEVFNIQRLIPLSSVSSGYLSYKFDFAARPTLVYTNATSGVSEAPNRAAHVADNVKLNVNQSAGKWNASQPFAVNSASVTSEGAAKAQQPTTADESATQISQASLLLSRRHLMMTLSGAGNAVWLRDYSLSETEKNQFTQRVLTNSTQFNINKVVLNGLIIWQNEEEA